MATNANVLASVSRLIASELKKHGTGRVGEITLSGAGLTLQQVYQALGGKAGNVDVTATGQEPFRVFTFVSGCAHAEVREEYVRLTSSTYQVRATCTRCHTVTANYKRMGSEAAAQKVVRRDDFVFVNEEGQDLPDPTATAPEAGTGGEGLSGGQKVDIKLTKGEGDSTTGTTTKGGGKSGMSREGGDPTPGGGSGEGEGEGEGEGQGEGGPGQGEGQGEGSGQGEAGDSPSGSPSDGQAGDGEGGEGEGDEPKCDGNCQPGDPMDGTPPCKSCTQKAIDKAAAEAAAKHADPATMDAFKTPEAASDGDGLGGEGETEGEGSDEAQNESESESEDDAWHRAFKHHWEEALQPDQKGRVYRMLSLTQGDT